MWQFLNQLNIFVEYVVKKRHSKKHIYTQAHGQVILTTGMKYLPFCTQRVTKESHYLIS